MENSSNPKCDTIGCPSRAVATLRWRDRDSGTEHTDVVCRSCGDGYVARPALRATLEPLGGTE